VPLKELGICHGDRRTIIDVVRIRTTTRAGRLLRPRHAGIEQGNPMSPTIFNLVMSAILGRVEDKSGCHAASYGDDIILVANSQAAAELAFRTFVEVTQDLGFRNVRPLGSVGKASRIFNTDLEPVPLIKTFRVSSRNIGLVDSKLEELRTRIGDRQLSLRQIRRLNKWKVLSKKSIRPLAKFWQGGTPETSGSHSLIGEAEIILAGVPADFSSDVGHLSCHGIEAGMGTIDPRADFRTDPLEDVPLYAHGSDSAVVPSPSTGESARHVSETETIVRMSLPGSASTTISSCPIESREVVYEAA
jgi:hypothetical protein